MPPDQNPTMAAVIAQQITFILDSVVELKEMVKGLDARMRAVELTEAGCQAINQSKIESAHSRIDEAVIEIRSNKAKIEMIEKKVPLLDELLGIKNKLIVIVALSGFVGTAVGGLIITFIFSYLFGGL